MKFHLLVLLLISTYFPVMSQWHDNNWILGYENGDGNPAETMTINFQTSPPAVNSHSFYVGFAATNTVISDEDGNFIFYSNGIQVRDQEGQLMPNGDSLNWGEIAMAFYEFGYPVPGGIIALPDPKNNHEYYLIHRRTTTNNMVGLNVPHLLFSKIDMELGGGYGAVTTKDSLIWETFYFDSSNAVKHANGRDWWVVTPDYTEAKYHRFLIDPEGIKDTLTQEIGYKPPFPQVMDYGGQNVFSPDGRYYVDFDAKNGVRLFDFDRCTGMLSNFRLFEFTGDIVFGGGAAFSPNSRFLYVCTRNHIFQFDVWADDFASTLDTVATYDGFMSPPPFPTSFYYMQLGPDGKIYVTHKTGAMHLHTINQPNKKGLASDVRQHSIALPEYKGGEWPTYPNYRLGPIDGSPCDTLGIDNVPLAHFTWEADTSNDLSIRFTDNSFYEPAEWFWDFGDGFTSQDTSPVHLYQGGGIFEICLTVSNANGSDIFCRTVEIILVSAEEAVQNVSVAIFPNPCREDINITLQGHLPNGAFITLYDALGHPCFRSPLSGGLNNLDLTQIAAGLYYFEIKDGRGLLKSGKLVRME